MSKPKFTYRRLSHIATNTMQLVCRKCRGEFLEAPPDFPLNIDWVCPKCWLAWTREAYPETGSMWDWQV